MLLLCFLKSRIDIDNRDTDTDIYTVIEIQIILPLSSSYLSVYHLSSLSPSIHPFIQPPTYLFYQPMVCMNSLGS